MPAALPGIHCTIPSKFSRLRVNTFARHGVVIMNVNYCIYERERKIVNGVNSVISLGSVGSGDS